MTCREIGLFLSVLLRVDSTTFAHCPKPGDRPALKTNKKRTSRLKPGKDYSQYLLGTHYAREPFSVFILFFFLIGSIFFFFF